MIARALALAGSLSLLASCGGEGVVRLSGQAGGGEAGQGGGGASGRAGAGGQGGVVPGGNGGQAGGVVPGGNGGQAAAGAGGASSGLACQAGEGAFVARATLAVLGRRPVSQAEIDVLVDLVHAVDAREGAASPSPGGPLTPGRRAAVDALMARGEYLPRWVDFYRDALRVERVDELANPDCYGLVARPDGPSLAAYVRDHGPEEKGDGGGPFTLLDLLRSSLVLDDVSPVYVAHLFSMMKLTITGANVTGARLELARRAAHGAWFDAAYLHRDGVCLRCHNSEWSVTASDDPATSRHFPLPFLLEKSLFGQSDGPPPEGEHDGVERAHAPLRYRDVVGYGPNAPWGWSPACGQFVAREAVPPDIAGVDAAFGSIHGDRSSSWDLAASLQAGFAKLRGHASPASGAGDPGEVADPDQAFAYLTSAWVAEQVWREMVGTPLTIATGFPRNQAARDQLSALTSAFVESGFSHRALVRAVLESPYANLLSPEAGCGPSPYPLPPLFDPWSTAADEPLLRGNSQADSVAPLGGRTLLRAAHAALGWPPPPASAFPDRTGPEGELEAGVGVFLKNAEPGFRGFDFQAALWWESRFGRCERPAYVAHDAVDALLDGAAADGQATVGDLVSALKDRLVNDPAIEPVDERPALEALVGASLDAPALSLGSEASPAMRRVCGALLASPQFLLSGLPPPEAHARPRLTPASSGYQSVCQQVAEALLPSGLAVSCQGGALSID